MDLDGDGSLSLFELEYFYVDVLQCLGEMNIECLSVENTVCQVRELLAGSENSGANKIMRERETVDLFTLRVCWQRVLNTFFSLLHLL